MICRCAAALMTAIEHFDPELPLLRGLVNAFLERRNVKPVAEVR
jgi:hypothetical protein